MKVLDLRCANGHGFEGWFDSEDDYMSQNGSGLLECPLCADKLITRMPSAPRLNLGAKAGGQPPQQQPGAQTPAPAQVPAQAVDPQALWMQAVRHVLANTEDVGERFPEEARRIHYGESQERGIRGQATPEQRAALQDEGIEVHALPVPRHLKEPLQ